MAYLFILLLLAHVIADFYAQSDRMVKNKSFASGWAKNFFIAHICHGLWHLLLWMLAGIFFLCTVRVDIFPGGWHLLITGLTVGIIHVLIDITKEVVSVKWRKNRFGFFILDQLAHVFFILLGVLWLSQSFGFVVSKAQFTVITPMLQLLTVLLGLLFILKPASVIVMLFLELTLIDGGVKNINITRSQLAKIFDDKFSGEIGRLVADEGLNAQDVDRKIKIFEKNTEMIKNQLTDNKQALQIDVSGVFATNNAGKWIGYVERVMIYLFCLSGQFTAVAAVMAIKTAFRFNDLKDDNDSQRSEYIMLGTFTSLFLTIITAVCVKHFMSVEHFREMVAVFRSTFL